MAPKAAEVLSLPGTVVGRADVTRLSRELEHITSYLEQAEIRSSTDTKMPQVSDVLEEVTHSNRLNLLRQDDRQRLTQFLKDLKNDAPSIHMSFAVIPSAQFTAKLLNWLRSEIHPMLLLNIGLQPNIAAGCVIRTTNKYIDCSMRQHLLANRPKLVERIRMANHA